MYSGGATFSLVSEMSADCISLHLFAVQDYDGTHELCFLITGNFYLH
jgi:hypothetical protein